MAALEMDQMGQIDLGSFQDRIFIETDEADLNLIRSAFLVCMCKIGLILSKFLEYSLFLEWYRCTS